MPQEQFQAFLLMIGIGMVTGLCYDVYRVTRSRLGLRRLGSSIGDFLFWFLMTPSVFAMLLYGNWGELRLYVFLGLACGLALYLKLASRLATEVILTLFIALNKLWVWFLSILALIWRAFTLPARVAFLVLGLPVQVGARAGSVLWQPFARHIAPNLKNRWQQIQLLPGKIAKLFFNNKKM